MNQFTRDAAKPAALVAGVLITGALVYLLFGDAIKKKLAAAGNLVNPASDQNLAYRSVNAVGVAITGRESFSVGSWVYDLFHEDAHLASNPKPKTVEEKSWYEQLNPFGD